MKNAANLLFGLFFIGLFSIVSFAQTGSSKPSPTPPSIVPIQSIVKPAASQATVSGKTYRNETYNFQLTFPDTWLIPENYLEDNILEHGYELKKADSPAGAQAKIDQNLDNIKILLTAYHPVPGTKEKSIVRVSVEDLSANPAVKDAVDYFDLMRENFKAMKLPVDFKYSETQAEKLGKRQFAFLDTTSKAGKKRLYATVRNGSALMFTLSYKSETDLQTFRQILSDGNFRLK